MGPPAADCIGRAAPATSARLKRPCARVLPASVRQGTQPCFSCRPHIGGGRCYRTGAMLTSLAGAVAKGQWRSERAMRRGPEYCPLWSESKGTVRRLVLAGLKVPTFDGHLNWSNTDLRRCSMEYTPRRKLTREFKLEAVRQTALSEKPKAQVARELGVRVGQLRTWRLEFEKEAVTGIAKPDRSPWRVLSSCVARTQSSRWRSRF